MSAPEVLIVAFRSDALLPGCLAALAGAAPVTVIDNDARASTRAIADAYGARYLPMPTNVGFAAAVNAGLARSWDGSSDVLLLNPDALLEPGSLDALIAGLHAPGTRRAAVGPRLADPSGRPQRPEWPMPSPLQVWLDAIGADRAWRGPMFITGAALMLNGEALTEIGALDERYFLYAEEADWQMRAQRAGWSVAVVPEATAVHVGAASSGDPLHRLMLFQASGRMFARRWYGRVGAGVMRTGSIVAAARRWLTQPDRRDLHRTALRLALHPGRVEVP